MYVNYSNALVCSVLTLSLIFFFFWYLLIILKQHGSCFTFDQLDLIY